MELQNLTPIDYANQRVLTTAQLAEAYGCKPTQIRDNFRKAKKHFTEGVDYFKVEVLLSLNLWSQCPNVIKFLFTPPICLSGKNFSNAACADFFISRPAGDTPLRPNAQCPNRLDCSRPQTFSH